MKPIHRALAALLVASSIGTLASGCSHKKDDGTTPAAQQQNLPALTIRDDTPDLMLTWIDEKGDPHVEIHPADVPAQGRALVRVVVADREDGTKDSFYVADLTHKGAGDAYVTETMSRRMWEAEIERRRAEYIAKNAVPPPPVPTGAPGAPPPANGPGDKAPAGGLTVIIYGASWCRPCHEAQGYLKSKGIAVIMKDIEDDPGAASEMRQKLERSGQHGGSIPVIDVKGQILVGYSSGALDRALARAATGAGGPTGTVL